MEAENSERVKKRGNEDDNYPVIANSYLWDDAEHYHQWKSWLIPMFVVINFVIFIVMMFINNCPSHNNNGCVLRFLGRFSFESLHHNPLLGPSSHTLLKMGALSRAKVVHQHEAWRLITCVWLHSGLVHLLVNMLTLFVIGTRLEHQFGFVRIGIIYMLSGLGGSIVSCQFIQNNISVGASGSLFGLIGAMLSELLMNWTIYTNKVAAVLTLLVMGIINIVVTVVPHSYKFADLVGGFLAGFLLGFVLLPRPHIGWLTSRHNLPSHSRIMKSKYKPYQFVLWFTSVALLVIGYVVGLVMLFRGAKAYDR